MGNRSLCGGAVSGRNQAAGDDHVAADNLCAVDTKDTFPLHCSGRSDLQYGHAVGGLCPAVEKKKTTDGGFTYARFTAFDGRTYRKSGMVHDDDRHLLVDWQPSGTVVVLLSNPAYHGTGFDSVGMFAVRLAAGLSVQGFFAVYDTQKYVGEKTSFPYHVTADLLRHYPAVSMVSGVFGRNSARKNRMAGSVGNCSLSAAAVFLLSGCCRLLL